MKVKKISMMVFVLTMLFTLVAVTGLSASAASYSEGTKTVYVRYPTNSITLRIVPVKYKILTASNPNGTLTGEGQLGRYRSGSTIFSYAFASTTNSVKRDKIYALTSVVNNSTGANLGKNSATDPDTTYTFCKIIWNNQYIPKVANYTTHESRHTKSYVEYMVFTN